VTNKYLKASSNCSLVARVSYLVGGFKPIETYVLELIILNQETISKDFKPTPESPKPVSQVSLAQTLVTE
jgi:hypothetical protein